MVTNYPQEMMTPTVGTTEGVTPENALSRLLKRVRFLLCGLHGHDPLLHFDRNRMYLRCASCGYETPGWELDQKRPRVRFRGDSRRQYLSRPQPLERDDRRIA
jgi:hypothetical protein